MRILQRKSLEEKQNVSRNLLKGKIDKSQTAELLGSTMQTIYNYLVKIDKGGLEALRDSRHSNNTKLTPKQLSEILNTKKDKPFSSARKVLEICSTGFCKRAYES